MTSLAISHYGIRSGVFAPLAAPALLRVASAISKLSVSLVGLYALSNVPAVEGKSMPSMGKPVPGMTDWQRDGFIKCMNACDKVEAEFLRLLCYIGCGVIDVFKNKKK